VYGLDITERVQAEEELKNSALETLRAFSGLVEANDPYTAGHSTTVTELALEIAREMELGIDQLVILRIAGPLHDVGKIGIPASTLNKPSKLTEAEWLMMRAHPVISAQTAERIAAFKDAVPTIRHHHERWDGTGYPDGLKGEDIPLLARILASCRWL
jgi:putative nucleotidyltransferase with HDIG domain